MLSSTKLLAKGRPPLLFIASWAKIAVTPSLGRFRDDQTRRSCAPDVSGVVTGRVQSSQNLPSEGVTAILAHGARKRSVGRPLAKCGAPLSLGGLCRCAWEPSNSLELDSVDPIE